MITVKIEAQGAIDMIRGLSHSIPKATKRGMYNLSRRAVKNLRQSAKTAGIEPWGGGGQPQLFGKRGIYAKKSSEYIWHIHMVKHGFYLDTMRPHWVALKRGRNITKWAQDKLGKQAGSVFVSPHPFINSAFIKTAKESTKIIEKELNRTIRKKGRGG